MSDIYSDLICNTYNTIAMTEYKAKYCFLNCENYFVSLVVTIFNQKICYNNSFIAFTNVCCITSYYNRANLRQKECRTPSFLRFWLIVTFRNIIGSEILSEAFRPIRHMLQSIGQEKMWDLCEVTYSHKLITYRIRIWNVHIL